MLLRAKPQCKQIHSLVWRFLVYSTPLQTGLKKKKRFKMLSLQRSKAEAPGRRLELHQLPSAEEKGGGTALSRPSLAPDLCPVSLCYFNFTTSKWRESRLIVSMSLDCDRRPLQNLRQPQLRVEDDGDGFPSSSREWLVGDSGPVLSAIHSLCRHSAPACFCPKPSTETEKYILKKQSLPSMKSQHCNVMR